MSVETDKGTHAPRGPSQRSERALAPDLARGSMLLFIALANCAVFTFAVQPGIEVDPNGFERVLNLLMTTLVNAHAYPVFAVMFGYGIVQLSRRQEASGASPDAIRSILVRRNTWLIVFGFVHALLLFFGDFLGAYGIVGLIITLLLLRRERLISKIVIPLWGVSLLYYAFLAYQVDTELSGSSGNADFPVDPVGSLSAGDYGSSIVDRLPEWPVHTASVIPFIFIVWLGIWGARRQVLERPAEHLVLLRSVAVVGLAIGIGGSIPIALVGAGMLDADQSTLDSMLRLQEGSGMFAGPGYVALFGLIAHRLMTAKPGSAVVTALAALGQRSLSGYLFQSLVWVLLVSPYTLHLGDRFGSPAITAAAIGLSTWLVSVLVSYAMDRRSVRGPAEIVLRRLTYGPRKT